VDHPYDATLNRKTAIGHTTQDRLDIITTMEKQGQGNTAVMKIYEFKKIVYMVSQRGAV
jgi:hypothetical protein